jgi:hypothetical protein
MRPESKRRFLYLSYCSFERKPRSDALKDLVVCDCLDPFHLEDRT